jgi:hypothetical protein
MSVNNLGSRKFVECRSKMKNPPLGLNLNKDCDFYIQEVKDDGNCQFHAVGHVVNELYDIRPSVQIMRDACALAILRETPNDMKELYDTMAVYEEEAPLAYDMKQAGMDWSEYQTEWAKTIRKTNDPSTNNWGNDRTLYYLSQRFRVRFIILLPDCRTSTTIGDNQCEYQGILLKKEEMHYAAVYNISPSTGYKTFLFDLDDEHVNQFIHRHKT